MNKIFVYIALAIVASISIFLVQSAKQDTEVSTTKNIPLEAPEGFEIATFAGGCFWCIEAPLQETEGVLSAISGYTGGDADTANYKLVASGQTSHREAVRIEYDPEVVTYAELVDIFFTHIDPTDAEGQFADRGYHYTTGVYYHTPEQEQIAQYYIQEIDNSAKFETPVVTQIVANQPFYPAEEYHQDYYLKASGAYKRYEKGSGRADYIEEVWQ